MSEVSCRAFSFFVAAEKAGLCNVDDLIAGLPLSRAILEDPNERVPWDPWSVLCDRFGDRFSSDDDLLATGRFALTEGFAGQLGRVAGLFVDPVRLYQVAIRWAAPGLYRSVAFSLEKVATGFIVDARLMPGYRPSRAWMVIFEGGLSQLPGHVGEPPTETRRISLDSTHARIDVPAARIRVLGGVQRALMAVRTPAAIADELTAQQEQLTRSWAEMRRASASFGNVLGALPVAVVVHTGGTAVYVNPAFAALAGAHPVELTGQTLAAFFGDAGQAALAALGPGATTDLSLSDSHCVMHHLRTGVVTGLEYGGSQVELVFGTDVTAELSGRERLARSEETLRALMETQPDMVIRLGRDLTILDVIPGHGIDEASTLLGLVGGGFNEVLQQVPLTIRSDFLEMVTQVRDAFERLQPCERAFAVPSMGSGKLRALRVRVTPILAGAEAIVVVRNETARVETEQRLALAERMASVGTLAAGVAHDINNPLTFVTLGTALLRSELAGLPDATQFDETLSNLDEGHRRIRDTVSRLQVLTRAERGSGVGVVVSAAIESAVAMTAHETRHRADVHVDVTARQKVNIGPTELGQILINLIVNAAHAIDSSHPELPHRITVSAHDDGPNVVFAVQDTGLGIAAEQLPLIFDPFFTTKAAKAGTGLGLTIIQRIVADAGGTIDVTSDVSSGGSGSTFRVSLPAVIDSDATVLATVLAAEPERPTPPTVPAKGRRSRVMVIDDDTLVSRMLVRALGEYDVIVYDDGQSGLQALLGGGEPPDVVICDLMMPGLSGAELHERITIERPALLDRLVFFTGGAFSTRAGTFLRRPDVRVMHKPVTVTTLRETVASIVKR